MYNFFHCVCTFCESHLGKILGNNKETKHTLTKWNPFTCVHVYQLSSKYIKYNPQTATHIFILTLILLPCLAIFLKWWPLIKILRMSKMLNASFEYTFWFYKIIRTLIKWWTKKKFYVCLKYSYNSNTSSILASNSECVQSGKIWSQLFD